MIRAVSLLALLCAIWSSAWATGHEERCPVVDVAEPHDAASRALFEAAKKKAPRLFRAIIGNDIRAVRRFLAQGDDPNACGLGASMIAHATGNMEMVDVLLKAGASLERPSNAAGETVLLHKIGVGELSRALQLIDRGADIGAVTDDGLTALHGVASVVVEPYSAAARDQLAIAREFLTRGHGTNVQTKDGVIITPLMIAVQQGNATLVKFLLVHGADPTLLDDQGVSATQRARTLRRDDIVWLLNDFSVPQTAAGQSPARLIEEGRNAELAVVLARLSPEAVQPRVHQALLAAAILTHNLDAIDHLVKWGTDPNAVSESMSSVEAVPVTPLIFAISVRAKGDVIERLIKAGADPNRLIHADTSDTPLSFALTLSDIEAAQALLKNGANPNLIADLGNWTPLMEAVSNVSPTENGPWFDFVARLLNAGAIASPRESHGFTALHMAAVTGNGDLIRLLLDHGADPDARDNRGRTPLDLARQEKSKPAIALLASIARTSK